MDFVRPGRRMGLLDDLGVTVGVPENSTNAHPELLPFDTWRDGIRRRALTHIFEFVDAHCLPELGNAGADVAADILVQFLAGGKCLRSTFVYLGWLCGAPPSDAALRAAASFELLHAFALLQDDVMDDSALRRGRPSAHIQFAHWHRERGLSGSARRFGESAAVLLGDLCLVWSEQMLRDSGVEPAALARAWPRYDAMRTELAVGQFADLVNDARGRPSLDAVLDVARRKSGNYTVRRPLEIGAAMGGCDGRTVEVLGEYGTAVGEAFQLRDDVLGVFGTPSTTGKPVSRDLAEHKATTLVVAARQLADPTLRRQLDELAALAEHDDATLESWRTLITATGASELVEGMIAERVRRARHYVEEIPRHREIADPVRTALTSMAAICADRTA